MCPDAAMVRALLRASPGKGAEGGIVAALIHAPERREAHRSGRGPCALTVRTRVQYTAEKEGIGGSARCWRVQPARLVNSQTARGNGRRSPFASREATGKQTSLLLLSNLEQDMSHSGNRGRKCQPTSLRLVSIIISCLLPTTSGQEPFIIGRLRRRVRK